MIKDGLEHGAWLQWLAESPTFGVRSAQRAMALAEWSVSHATYFTKWADLGPTKLEILKSQVRKSIRTVHGLLPRARKMDAGELVVVEQEVTRR